MILRHRLASAVVLALLAVASVSHAQTADSVATKGPIPGRGGVGGQIGSSYLVAGPDYKDGAQPRFTFVGHFRYQINPTWGWQVSPYFTWNGYVSHVEAPFVDLNFPTEGKSKEDYLTFLRGASIQLQWFRGKGRTRWHLGAGPAVYQVVVEHHRKVIEDPKSHELHKGLHLGATGEFGYEKFMKKLPNTSIEATAAWQIAYARSDERFPSGWNANPQLAEIRLGVHYYYDFRKPKPTSNKPGLGK